LDHVRICDLSQASRPREKAASKGLAFLSDEDLLALILGKGVKGANAVEVAQNLLATFGGLKRMGSYHYRAYEKQRGVSHAKALALAAIFELAKRIRLPDLGEKPKLDPEILYHRYKVLFSSDARERVVLLELDKKGWLIKETTFYQGTESGVRYNESEIIKELAANQAVSFVMVHNHPSGRAIPSPNETEATFHLGAECLKLGIHLKDHLIISEDGYFSFLNQPQTPF